MQHIFSAAQQAAVDKVHKILALAKSTTSEGEMENAMAAAQRILDDHNLDMALVERSGGQGGQAKREDKRQGGGLYQWQRDLWKRTAELNFCMYFAIKGLRKGDKYEHRVIGRTENILATELMAGYLQGRIENSARDWAKHQGLNIFARDAIAYREGMSDRICVRLQDLRRERLAEDERKQREARAAASHPGPAPGTGLVLASVIQAEEDANKDIAYGLPPGTHAEFRAKRAAASAEWQAQQDAKEAEHKAKYGVDPEYTAQFDAKAEADRKYWEAYEQKQAKRAARRKGVDRAYRERAPTGRESRQYSSAYRQGVNEGDNVGLDQQVGEKRNGLLS